MGEGESTAKQAELDSNGFGRSAVGMDEGGMKQDRVGTRKNSSSRVQGKMDEGGKGKGKQNQSTTLSSQVHRSSLISPF